MKKILSLAACLLMGAALFTACDSDDDNTIIDPNLHPTAGIYVLSEGSYFYKINGALDYYGYTTDGLTTDRGVFYKANGRYLGGTPNNALIASDGNMYIVTTEDNRVEIIDPATRLAKDPIKVTQPRELATDGTDVYISSYKGKVYKYNTVSAKLTDSTEVVGTNLEGVAVVGDYVYVCNAWNPDGSFNTNVVKLDKNLNKVKDITVVTNPTQLLTNGTDLFVVSMGNYTTIAAQLQRIDTSTDVVTTIAPATMAAIVSGRLYLVNAPWGGTATYSYYDIQSKTVNTWPTPSEVFLPYAIAVDPNNGNVLITSKSEDPDKPGSPSNTADGYLTMYKSDGTFMGKYDCGLNPGTIVFYIP